MGIRVYGEDRDNDDDDHDGISAMKTDELRSTEWH